MCRTEDKMFNSGRNNKSYDCELQAKFIQNRINLVEKKFAEFCSVFSEYSRKAAKMRNAGDALSEVAKEYAESNKINNTLQKALLNFSKHISLIGDYGHLRVLNINKNITNELSQYELLCKHCKEDVKEIFASREKESIRKKQLERIREKNPKNHQQIIQAETELAKATSEVSHTMHKLEEQMINFEQKKNEDIKTILLDFIRFEIGYHSKALEQFTMAFNSVQNINQEHDAKEFKKYLQESTDITDSKHSLFKNSQSLSALNLFSKSKNRRRDPGIPSEEPNNSQRISKSVDDVTLNENQEESEISSQSDAENTTDWSEETD